MTPQPRSITARLVFWLFLGTAAVLAAAGVFLYTEVREIVIGSVDRTLHSKRQMITGLLHEEHGGVELELSEIIAGEYVIPRSGHYYRVTMDGRILAASPSLVDDNFVFLPPGTAAKSGLPREIMYTSTGPDDEPVRVLRYHYAAFNRDFDIVLAESLVESFSMVGTFRRYLLIAIPLTLIILSITARQIARASLRPLESFSTTIESISHKNLSDRISAETTARELAQLARQFNDMLDRLHAVFESQKRLVADASHELKTPVSVIRAQCDVALQRSRTPAEYIEALREIQSSSRGMARLISDLLSLARIDAGLPSPQDFTPVPLGECIRGAVKMAEPLAAERRVTISTAVDDSLVILGSRTALSEAFLNLVENAVRYNVEGGAVSVAAKTDCGRTIVTVSDTGVGIGKDDLGKIFERFYRASTARSVDGTGLGLSIVQAVVQAHGGAISVESEPGAGSTFTVLLPAGSFPG